MKTSHFLPFIRNRLYSRLADKKPKIHEPGRTLCEEAKSAREFEIPPGFCDETMLNPKSRRIYVIDSSAWIVFASCRHERYVNKLGIAENVENNQKTNIHPWKCKRNFVAATDLSADLQIKRATVLKHFW